MISPAPSPAPALRRSLGLATLVFYGLGLIVGAGIYVAVGTAAKEAGAMMPAAFLIAGVLAGLTGLSYAELAARLPEAGGAAAYIHHAWGKRWPALLATTAVLLIALVGAASIARGSAGYVGQFLDVPAWLPGAVLIAVFGGLACLRVSLGAALAAIVGAIEIGGLVFVIAVGADALGALPARAGELVPRSGETALAALHGTFIVFFAYIGFESVASLAEETKNARRTVPRAIVAAIGAATLLYVALGLVAVLALPMEKLAGAPAPLCLLLERRGMACGDFFAYLALAALSNGVFAEIVVAARVLYGMAHRGLLPAAFARLSGRERVPVLATLAGTAVALALVTVLNFATLASAVSALTLALFAAVNAALWSLKRDERAAAAPAGILTVPAFVPAAGFLSCLGLLLAAAIR